MKKSSLSRKWRYVLAAAVCASLAQITAAHAEGPRVHGTAGVAHAVGGVQASEFGWGGGASLGAELPLAKAIGVQAVGALYVLSKGDAPKDGFAEHQTGVAVQAMGGIRLHPFGRAIWLDGDVGVCGTGSVLRPAMDAHLGYDFASDSAWTAGPYLGYSRVFQPDSPRPDDAQVVSLGMHISFGSPTPPRPAPPKEETPEPATRVAAIEVKPTVVTASDRDLDGVEDLQDRCPDLAGPASADPELNGCPPPGDSVRVSGDRLVMDERVHFDFASSHVHNASVAVLKKVVDYVGANPTFGEIRVEGHADEVGTDEYNATLSQQRADSVRKVLLRLGITSVIVAEGYGKSRPRADGHSELEHRQNRRVEFIVSSRPQKEVQ